MAAANSTISQTCSSCVQAGHTWCKADDFFGGPDICAADAYNGFFGDCSDINFGADDLNSEVDCLFGTSAGEVILTIIIVVVLLLVFRWSRKWYKKNQNAGNRLTGIAMPTISRANRAAPSSPLPTAEIPTVMAQGVVLVPQPVTVIAQPIPVPMAAPVSTVNANTGPDK